MNKLRKQSDTGYPLFFFMVDSTDHVTGKTGLTPTVTISKNGASFASPSGAVTEVGNGLYKIAGNATDSNTLGELWVHATGTGADPSDTSYTVVPYSPFATAIDSNMVQIDGAATNGNNAILKLKSLDIQTDSTTVAALNIVGGYNGSGRGTPGISVVGGGGNSPGYAGYYMSGAGSGQRISVLFDSPSGGSEAGTGLVIRGNFYPAVDISKGNESELASFKGVIRLTGASYGSGKIYGSLDGSVASLGTQAKTDAATAVWTDATDYSLAGDGMGRQVMDILASLESFIPPYFHTAQYVYGSHGALTTSQVWVGLGSEIGNYSIDGVIVEQRTTGGTTETTNISLRRVVSYNPTTGIAEVDAPLVHLIDSGTGEPFNTTYNYYPVTLTSLPVGSLSVAAISDISSSVVIRPKKNTGYNNFMFPMFDSSTKSPKVGVTVTAERAIDGNPFAPCASSVVELGNGVYRINLSAADLNGDKVMFRFSGTGADDQLIEIFTQG